MGPGVLSKVLNTLPKMADENLLVGYNTSDDACVYRLREDLALVETVDFFPPMVDDPYLFGQIAAANALSDVYAMGAKPTLAMNLLCVPSCLPIETVGEVLRGGADKAIEAGCIISGGHTIDDEDLKYGLCVTGVIHPDHVLTNLGAKVGDQLVLTKPLGAGILSTTLKTDLLTQESKEFLYAQMSMLNAAAAQALQGLTVHACTDVTGFGLAGHACEMAGEQGDITLSFSASALPHMPQVQEMADMGMIPGGAYRNRDYFQDRFHIAPHIKQWVQDLFCDPQTSGGLLVAMPKQDAEEYLSRLASTVPLAKQVGEVLAYQGSCVQLV